MEHSTSKIQDDRIACSLETEDHQDGRYLTFRLGRGEYGIAIRHVVEIVGLQQITAMPDQPGFMKGVINLRGKIIPVMGGRERFGMAVEPYDERTCVIVLDVAGQLSGLIVDRVSEVLEIGAAQVEPPVGSFSDDAGQCVCGLGKVGDRVKILLDTARLF